MKRLVLFILAAAAMLIAAHCTAEVTTYTIINDKSGIAVSFDLSGKTEDWTVYDNKNTNPGWVSYTFSPASEDAAPGSSWQVHIQLITVGDFYPGWIDQQTTDEDHYFVYSPSGVRWYAARDPEDYEDTYQACLDSFLNGCHKIVIDIEPDFEPDEATPVDLGTHDALVSGLLDSFTYTTEYAGRTDHGDAAYYGDPGVKWPLEIPYEDGTITAERLINSNGYITVLFSYADPVREGLTYHVCVNSYTKYDPLTTKNKESFLDYKYFGPSPLFKSHTFTDSSIGGLRAAFSDKFGSGDYGTGHEVIVDFGDGGSGIFNVITFRSSTKLDKSKAKAAKEANPSAYEWLSDFDAKTDEYSHARADEVLCAVVAATEFYH